MSDPSPSPHAAKTPKPSSARERLLRAAIETFDAEGVNRTGVDRLIAVAGVTRATFYRHFPGKDDLVLAYVRAHDEELRSVAQAAIAESTDPTAQLKALVDGLAVRLTARGFRGSVFINTAAEHPDASSPVRQAIIEHRRWFRDALRERLMASGHDAPEFAADLLVMLHDGAQVGASLDDPPAAVRATFLRAVGGVLGS